MGLSPELRSLGAGWQLHRAQEAHGHVEFPQRCWQSRRSVSLDCKAGCTLLRPRDSWELRWAAVRLWVAGDLRLCLLLQVCWASCRWRAPRMEARGPCLSSAATQVSWASAEPSPARPVLHSALHWGTEVAGATSTAGVWPSTAVQGGSGATSQRGLTLGCCVGPSVSWERGWQSCWSPQGPPPAGRVTQTRPAPV